ncbi:MAG: type III pantothenate kinase [Armatimonadetes bacterium]|nr:type III pantothenate kinase [Armatimonadota bacterium]
MLLAVDAGNSRLKCAAFSGDTVVGRRAVRSASCQAPLGAVRLFTDALEGTDPASARIAVASVCPRLNPIIAEAAHALTGRPALFVTHRLRLGLEVAVSQPDRLGADRIANAVAAAALLGAPVIVVDFGTASTLTVVSRDRKLLGGSIAPGIRTSASALAGATGQLPEITDLATGSLPCAIGANTEEAIRSGIVYGTIGMVNELLQRVRAELGEDAPAIATGGNADAVAGQCPGLALVDPDLTFQGIRLIAKNSPDA